MPVESKIIHDQTAHKWHYPALGVTKKGGHFFVVLFDRHGEGTCLYRGQDAGTHVGGHGTFWDMGAFEPWHGSVIIESKGNLT